MSHIENWVQSGQASVVIQNNRIEVKPNCAVEIQSFSDPPNCMESTTTSETVPVSGLTTIAIVVATVSILVIGIIAIFICICCLRRRRKRYYTEKKSYATIIAWKWSETAFSCIFKKKWPFQFLCLPRIDRGTFTLYRRTSHTVRCREIDTATGFANQGFKLTTLPLPPVPACNHESPIQGDAPYYIVPVKVRGKRFVALGT